MEAPLHRDSVQALQASVQALTLQVQNLTVKKKNNTNRSDKSHPANNNCKGVGHTLEECWKLGEDVRGNTLLGGKENGMAPTSGWSG